MLHIPNNAAHFTYAKDEPWILHAIPYRILSMMFMILVAFRKLKVWIAIKTDLNIEKILQFLAHGTHHKEDMDFQ